MRLRFLPLVCSFALTLAACGSTQESPSVVDSSPGFSQESRQVNVLFDAYTQGRQPGCAVAVVDEGKVVHKAAYGHASLDHSVPLNADSMFRVASLSKQFTAAALALAAEDGLVDLDAPIGRYLPNLHPRTRQIPLRFFLTHTAGFAGFEESLQPHVKGITGEPVTFGTGDYLTPDELYELSRLTAPMSDPGERFTYSNMSYFWLGRVIERVTDEPLRQYIARKLLVPAGMRRSFISDNADEVIPDRATAYSPLEKSPDGSAFERSETNLDWVGANALVTSLNEFLLWDEQFRKPTIGPDPQAFRDLLVSRQADLENDKPDGAGYAFGLYVKDNDTYGPSVYHRGSWAAYRSIYKRYLREDFAYFIFCNRSDVDREQISQAIEDIYLGSRS